MSGRKNHRSTLKDNSRLKKQLENNDRETGIEILGKVPWGTHLCQFYKTKEDLLDILIPYFKTGLQNNEFCMWITSEPLHADEAKKVLQKKLDNFDDYLKKGQIEILESTEWYTKSGTFNAEKVLSGWIKKEAEARKNGFDGLRLTGNTFWLEKKDWKDFTNYEEVINHVIGNYKMVAICSYSLDRCNASEIIDVVSNHQFAIIKREGLWHRIENPEAKKVETALNESRFLLETVFSSMNEAVAVLNKTGEIINFNDAFAHFCRFKNREECLNNINEFANIIKVYTLDGKLLTVEEWPAARGLRGETGFNKEFLIERTDLGISWISSSSFAPLRNKNGDIIGVVQTMHDITEQKKYELEKEHQARLLNLVQDGIIRSDPNFRITYWNKGAELMYGYSETEALGKTTTELLRPMYSPGEREKIINDLNHFGRSKARIRTRHRDGTEIIADVNSTRINDENGKITGYVVTYRDMTDRERVQAALREAELKYRTVADNTYDFEFWIDSKGRYLYVSPSCERTTGHSKEEFVNDPSLRKRLIHPDDKQIFLDHVFYEALNKNPGELEFRIIHKDGSVRWIHHVCQPLVNEKGKFIGTRGSNRDITQRKIVEERVQTLFNSVQMEKERLNAVVNSMQEEVWFADKEKKFTLINPSALNEFKLNSHENVDIEKFAQGLEVLRNDGSPRSVEDAPPLRALKGEVIRNEEEIIRTPATGELRWRQVNAAPVRDADGNIFGSVSVVHDITERKKVEEQLRETSNYLENLINYANAPIIVWDKDFKIIRFNHAFEHLTGFTSKMMIGKNLHVLFPEENKEESLQKIRRTLSGEYWESVEIPIQHKDGSTRIALWNSANIYDNQKKSLIATIAQGTDITQRKQAEEALRESESRLHRAQEISHIGSWELDLGNNHLIWSDEVYRIFGLKPREFKATYEAFLQLIHPDDRAAVDNAYTASLREGRDSYEIEHRIVRKNGEVRFVYEKCAHIRDKNGKIVQSIGMVHDITERKLSEAELVRLASFPAKNPMPVIEVDFSGKPHYLNPRAIQLFPNLEEKGVNHPFLKGINNLIPENEHVRNTPVIREVKVYDTYYLQTLIDIPESKHIRIYGMDITDRKKAEKRIQESEEKYRRIVENTTNVIMVTQPDGSISYLSPASATILGYSSEELIGTNPNIFHPDDAQKVHDALARALKGEKGSNFEYRILTKQGEVKWVSHSWSPLLINTKLQSIISVIEDITQRKNSEENIKKLNEILLHHSIDLAAANKELEAFSYSVSHDLRAPLRSIDGFSQALLEDYSDKLNDQGKDYIKRVRTATQRMGQLIDDMLRLSRLTRAELHYEPVDFSSLTLENIQKLQTVEPSRKIDIKIQRGINVNGDKKLLEILLDNLIGNAWKFTRNTKHPKIEFGKMNNETESVYFIRDNGAGFDMTYADKLFIPFQRLHSVDEFPGTGIGLAIVSRIVHRHGGRIWAESEVGKGATFYFTLEGKKVK